MGDLLSSIRSTISKPSEVRGSKKHKALTSDFQDGEDILNLTEVYEPEDAASLRLGHASSLDDPASSASLEASVSSRV